MNVYFLLTPIACRRTVSMSIYLTVHLWSTSKMVMSGTSGDGQTDHRYAESLFHGQDVPRGQYGPWPSRRNWVCRQRESRQCLDFWKSCEYSQHCMFHVISILKGPFQTLFVDYAVITFQKPRNRKGLHRNLQLVEALPKEICSDPQWYLY